MTRLVRRFAFNAAHVLARPDWTDERNRAVYGKCANPASHGHSYAFELAFEGEVDPRTGQLVPPAELERLVADEVLAPLDGRLLNRDVPAFARAVPTAENIARHIWDTLAGRLAPAKLVAVRLFETRNNSVEYTGGEKPL
ncbi:MAG TPA: 6-carboxytetrahydropterin synthase [Myxococcota bacterium]|nr:6-carboxytetrahydropterin synthase [Myxococcota bacterium]